MAWGWLPACLNSADRDVVFLPLGGDHAQVAMAVGEEFLLDFFPLIVRNLRIGFRRGRDKLQRFLRA